MKEPLSERELQRKIFWETIDILEKSGLLPHVLVIGSWAEYLWEEANYIEGFTSNLRTRDMDILMRNLRIPREKIDITALLEANGYLLDRSHEGISKFYKDGVLEIEFLVLEKGRGQIAPYELDNLGIKVPGLRELSILVENPIALRLRNHDIFVPTPQSYVLHKMSIQRNSAYKVEKDAAAIGEIIEAMRVNKSHMEILKLLYEKLNKKQKNLIKEHCETHSNPMLQLLDQI